MNTSNAAKKNITDATHLLFKQWSKNNPPPIEALSTLRLYKNLLTQKNWLFSEPHLIYQQLIKNTLPHLATRNEEAAFILENRYLNGKMVNEVLTLLKEKRGDGDVMAHSSYHHVQNKAITYLAEVMWEQEQQAILNYELALKQQTGYPLKQKLFGITPLFERLTTALNQTDRFWLIALEGLGGLGKTSLAAKAVETHLKNTHFYGIAWLTAKQELFSFNNGLHLDNNPALALNKDSLIETLFEQLFKDISPARPTAEKQALIHKLCKRYPYLIVIDNLETQCPSFLDILTTHLTKETNNNAH